MSKTLTLLLFILENSKDISDMTEMKVYKLLYFLEKVYYQKYRTRIGDQPMQKLAHGPVFQKLKMTTGLDDFVDIKMKGKRNYYQLKKGADFKLNFSEQERATLLTALDTYKKLSASELRTLSHNEAPYLMAEEGKNIDISHVRFNDAYQDESSAIAKTYEIDLGFSQDEMDEICDTLMSKYN